MKSIRDMLSRIWLGPLRRPKPSDTQIPQRPLGELRIGGKTHKILEGQIRTHPFHDFVGGRREGPITPIRDPRDFIPPNITGTFTLVPEKEEPIARLKIKNIDPSKESRTFDLFDPGLQPDLHGNVYSLVQKNVPLKTKDGEILGIIKELTMSSNGAVSFKEGDEEGEICGRAGCMGVLALKHQSDEGCTCFRAPPCGYCMSEVPECPTCGWVGDLP